MPSMQRRGFHRMAAAVAGAWLAPAAFAQQRALLPVDEAVLAEQQRTADFYWKAGLIRQRLDVRATFDAQA